MGDSGKTRSDFAQNILDKIDIVHLISEDCELTPDGERLQGAHSIHPSKSGTSLKVYPDQQSFYCFNCGRGGTAIDYIIAREGCSPSEAIKFLCEKYNISMPEWSEKQKKEYEQRKSEKDIVSEILYDAFKFYHDTMLDERRAYFHKRGMTDETINRELLGYAPEGDNLYEQMKGKYQPKQLLLSGMFCIVNGSICDAYQRRYLFPYWHHGKIVYSIGRLDTDEKDEIAQLPAWNKGKYKKHLTRKDSHPYVSDTIENLIWNADCVRKYRSGIITEGIVDGLMGKQEISPRLSLGIISPVTTKFAQHDIDRLTELTKQWETVYLINDEEESKAGLKGALDTAQKLFSDGRDVRIVRLPKPEYIDKMDLADFLNIPEDFREARVSELKSLMDASYDFIEYRIDEIAQKKEDEKAQQRELKVIMGEMINLDKLRLERYCERIQKTGLIKGKRTFYSALKSITIEKRKEAKQKRMKEAFATLEKEEFIKVQIDDIRKQEFKKVHEIKHTIGDLVTDAMKERGRFYKTVENQTFWFDETDKRLYPIGDDVLGAKINQWYEINQKEPEYEFLLSDLNREALLNGTETEVYRFAFYDKKAHVLYVYNNADRTFRIDGKEIALVDNGTDGILFLKNPLCEPFTYYQKKRDYILPLIIEPTNFNSGGGVILNRAEQEIMLRIWLYSLFFESIQPTKPIQLFVGEKGSGKTTRQRTIGIWLFGKHFDVYTIEKEKEDAFTAAISNNYFIAFDNVDSSIPWLNDRLAQAATGHAIPKRELYTTNTLVNYFPKCFISLNSRTPKFKRDDVVDRLLLFRVNRLEKFRKESEILDEILSNRDNLWSELLDDLNLIVKALKEDKERFVSGFRLADWADLGWRIAKTKGAGNTFIKLLEKMDVAQSEFLLEDNPLFDCLDIWLENTSNRGREVTASQLYNELQIVAEANKVTFPFKSARSLGMHLQSIQSDLGHYYQINSGKIKNRWVYEFQIK
jgi:DNA primase catalytic core